MEVAGCGAALALGRGALASADAQTLKDVLDAQIVDGASLASGEKVVDADDALAWILEQIRSAPLV